MAIGKDVDYSRHDNEGGNANVFVASVTGSFDSALALFNGRGYGIYANDDIRLSDANAGLQAYALEGRQAAGWYYLRVFDVNSTSQSVVMVSR